MGAMEEQTGFCQRAGRAAIEQVLRAAGSSPDPSSFANALASQFLDAVVESKLEAALAMLAACPEIARLDVRKAGRGALHWCCSLPSMGPCAKALLALGCPVDGHGDALDTPLRWAADAGGLDAVEALLWFGASPTVADLFAACRGAHGACAMALFRGAPHLDPFAPAGPGLPSCFDELAKACAAFAHPCNEQRLRAREALAFFERHALDVPPPEARERGSRRL